MPTTSSPRRFIIVDDNTIQEKRDRQEEKRPRKRQRVESDDEDVNDTPSKRRTEPNLPFSYPTVLTESKDVAERDPVYYKDDPSADCVVRVKNTLFKVSNYRPCFVQPLNKLCPDS